MSVDPHKEVLKVRARLNNRLAKARLAVQKAAENLDGAIAIYNKTHNAAAKASNLVPSDKHRTQIDAITRGREKLTQRLLALGEVEDEHRKYFIPVK